MDQPLLTISIPTYNRDKLLDKCLDAIFSQVGIDIKDHIEFIVSDNCSVDDTTAVVNKYIDKGFPIRYYKNPENLGPDRNIAGCFLKATGKYVWIFSDDDFMLPGFLRLILDLLGKDDWGNIYLHALAYSGEFKYSKQPQDSLNYKRYDDPIKFVERVNYWSTFITGNIINKNLIKDPAYVAEFYDSYLVQISWIMPIIFSDKENIVVDDQVVACLTDNTGGYKLYKVFGKNFNWILDQLISKKMIDPRSKVIINKNLLKGFFPMFLHNKNFINENPLNILFPIYWGYPYFWRAIFPPLVKRYFKSKWLKN